MKYPVTLAFKTLEFLVHSQLTVDSLIAAFVMLVLSFGQIVTLFTAHSCSIGYMSLKLDMPL